MASFDEERTTIAADSGDSSDANKTNNGGIARNLHELNTENNNVCRVSYTSGSMACGKSSPKMEENQSNVLSSVTTTEIVGVQNGISATIQKSAYAENNAILASEKTVPPPLAMESVVSHVEKTISPIASASGKHVPSDKSKGDSGAKHSSANTKTGERSQHTHHSSKSQSTSSGKFECVFMIFRNRKTY